MIPEGWQAKTLGDVLTLQRGYDLPSTQRKVGENPITSSGGISGWHEKAQATPPGIVTGRYGTIGEVLYVEVDFWPLNTTLYVKDFKGNYPKYLFYLLNLRTRNLAEILEPARLEFSRPKIDHLLI